MSMKTSSPNTTLCFGSRLSRNRIFRQEVSDTPGPGEYFRPVDLIKKYPNKSGYTLLASKTPRYKNITEIKCIGPPVGTYDTERKKNEKQSAKPFGIGATKLPERSLLTPAPGTYTPFKREERVCTSFGRGRIHLPMAEIICGQFNMAFCSLCRQTPIGDYWHRKDMKQDICRPCMEQQLANLRKCETHHTVRKYMTTELNKFILRRYCSFYHTHHCTQAAVRHLPNKELTFKIRKENYLASYGL